MVLPVAVDVLATGVALRLGTRVVDNLHRVKESVMALRVIDAGFGRKPILEEHPQRGEVAILEAPIVLIDWRGIAIGIGFHRIGFQGIG